MNDIIADSEAQRRIKVGLSPALLSHASEGQQFLGFISYRRRDGLALAKWLRDRITSFQAPIELRDKIAAIDASVGGKQNRVFFDMSYQRPNVDFWDEHIAASLCRSKTLILLQTPSVLERLDDGEANWCEREIETYLKYYGEPSRILVVMGPGAPIDTFPEPLANISARWDWIDLRFFSESPLQRFRHGGQYDPLIAKILAKIYNIADGDLPLLNREFAKSRARVRRVLATAACLTIVSLSGLTAWALRERDRATAAEQVAVEQRDAAIRQRNAALVAQSRFLAKAADEQSNAGSARAAIAILQEALPNPATGRDRPLVAEAVSSAYRAIYDNRETGRLPMPPDAVATTSDGIGGRIVTATSDRLFISNGVDPAPLQIWTHEFGPAQSLVMSASGNRVVMIASDGALMVRDLADNHLVLSDAGMGRNTTAVFVQGGAKLLVGNADQTRLQLFDLDDGSLLIATRDLAPAKGKPVATHVDGDFIAVVVDAMLLRLSPDDLTTLASVTVPDMTQYAFTLSLDRTRLFFGAAERVAVGSIFCFDAATLSLQREFGRLAFGATSMAASPTHNLLAVTTSTGVDFFDSQKFETIGHITSVPLNGGRFRKDGLFYIGYNSAGDILQIVPELLITTAYKTIDGGAIRQIDMLEDGSGFLSLSDRPSITRWMFHPSNSSLQMSVPWVIKKIDTKRALPISASDFSKADDTLVASHYLGPVKRWNLEDGTSKIVRNSDPRGEKEIAKVVALGNGITLIAQKSGMIQVYDEAAGPETPLTEIETGAVETFAAISTTSVFVVTNGLPKLLDVSDARQPKVSILDKLGNCPRSGGGTGVAICVDTDGSLRALKLPDNLLVADLPPPVSGFNAAAVSENGHAVLTADKNGTVEWRQGRDLVRQWALKGTISGQLLTATLAKGALSSTDAAAVRAGSKSVNIPMPPSQFEFAPDEKRFAAIMPNGAIKLLTPMSDATIDIPAREGRYVWSVKFSAHGQFLAVIDFINEPQRLQAMMVVYDTATGSRMFAFNCDPELLPTVHALANGQGFVTVNPRGTIFVHPVFEKATDLVNYLTQRFSTVLTAAQRKQFFIE